FLSLVYIAAETTVGIDTDRELETSDGGVLRNPLPTLQALCTIAHRSMVQPRRNLRVNSGRIIPGVQVGDMIASHNAQTCDTIVQEIVITTPVMESDSPPPMQMMLNASTHSVDVVSLMGRVPTPQAETWR
ncbi:MAG: hypothetical protein AAF539_00815, partial [Planctomycetota bacterium]